MIKQCGECYGSLRPHGSRSFHRHFYKNKRKFALIKQIFICFEEIFELFKINVIKDSEKYYNKPLTGDWEWSQLSWRMCMIYALFFNVTLFAGNSRTRAKQKGCVNKLKPKFVFYKSYTKRAKRRPTLTKACEDRSIKNEEVVEYHLAEINGEGELIISVERTGGGIGQRRRVWKMEMGWCSIYDKNAPEMKVIMHAYEKHESFCKPQLSIDDQLKKQSDKCSRSQPPISQKEQNGAQENSGSSFTPSGPMPACG